MKNAITLLILVLCGFSFTAHAADKASAPVRVETFKVTCKGDNCPDELPESIRQAILADPLPTIVQSERWSPAAKILAVAVLTFTAGGIGGIAGWSSGKGARTDENNAYYRDTRWDSALLAGGISAGSMLLISGAIAFITEIKQGGDD